jgi:hypothetical protein
MNARLLTMSRSQCCSAICCCTVYLCRSKHTLCTKLFAKPVHASLEHMMIRKSRLSYAKATSQAIRTSAANTMKCLYIQLSFVCRSPTVVCHVHVAFCLDCSSASLHSHLHLHFTAHKCILLVHHMHANFPSLLVFFHYLPIFMALSCSVPLLHCLFCGTTIGDF